MKAWRLRQRRNAHALQNIQCRSGPVAVSGDGAAVDASIDDAHARELSARWGRIEELAWGSPLADDEMLPVIEEIAALARRARDAGENLYCWCCL